jgi:hypothetical protein
MKVQEVVDIARYSELASVAVKDNTAAIVSFLNLGMVELYTRFPIKTEEHLVELQENTTMYEMPADFMYALSAYGEVPEDAPKTDTLRPVPINEEDDPYSIFFPDWNTVQIPAVANGSYISIIYVAKPATITPDNLDVELELPDTLIDALVSYIGYRAHMGIRGDGQSDNNAHWQRFDRNCKKARELGVAFPVDSLRMSERITDRGFA